MDHLTATGRLVSLLEARGVIRPRDLAEHDIPRSLLQRLVARGDVERVGRSLYTRAGAPMSEHRGLAEAVARNARIPHLDRPPVRFVRVSGAAFTESVGECQASCRPGQ